MAKKFITIKEDSYDEFVEKKIYIHYSSYKN